MSEKIVTTLGRETAFKGKMEFTKTLKIDGKFEGEIDSSGSLYIEEGARVRADIKARSITIGGIVHGNVTAAEKLVILSTGRVIGNITASRLRIADGVIFEGKCIMIRDPESIDIFSGKVEKLKKTVSSV